MNFEFDRDQTIEVVRTSRIKTASIKIIDGSIKLAIPEKLSDTEIKQLIKRRSFWIKQKIKQQASIVPYRPKEYVSGESFPYLGRNYRLKLLHHEGTGVKLKDGYLECSISKKADPQKVKEILVSWYKEHALERLIEKTERYSKIIRANPQSVDIKDYKARWASCSSNGKITYNWRIILAPHHIVDYIVVHELCHIMHPNHSTDYWKSVKNILPDYKECREWLRSNGNALNL